MQFQIQHRYLNLPVKNGAPMRQVSLFVNGRLVRQFEIELAGETPDFWAFLDLSDWMGQSAVLQVDPPVGLPPAVALFEQSQAMKGSEDLYREKLRPAFHFTCRRGWNNDPNGLLYTQGEYHLFFQHNPYGIHWGNMHWGHAVSRDLLHWEELPEALYPDELGTMFSGSGVVDEENTSGFQTGHEKPLVLVYTAAGGTSPLSQGKGFTQCLAYSNDRGRTWTKWAGNPVLPQVAGGNRDPKVIWHAPTRQWIMALYLEGNDFALFTSPDLKAWTRLFDYSIPGCIECPDLFELPVDGNPRDTRWVLWGSNTSYLIGRFDGQVFTQESAVMGSHWGGNSYAAQTWSDIPPEDGRRIQISWLQVEVPGMPFNQGLTFPVELSLRSTPQGIRLCSAPIREIATLYRETRALPAQPLRPGENPLGGMRSEVFDLQAELGVEKAEQVGLVVRGMPVVYEARQGLLTCLGKSLPLQPVGGKLNLRLLVDRTSLEIFANGGEAYLPLGVVFDPQDTTLQAIAQGGSAWIEKIAIHELASIWNSEV